MSRQPDNPRRGSMVFKVAEPRFRAPDDVERVLVGFGVAPFENMLIKRIRGRKIVLKATVLEPPSVAGRHLLGFFNPPPDGTLPGGSRLAAAARVMLGKELPEGEPLDLNRLFGNRRAWVSLRRVKNPGGDYHVLDQILVPG